VENAATKTPVICGSLSMNTKGRDRQIETVGEDTVSALTQKCMDAVD